MLALVVLAVVYFLSMYLFSMLTAHITAMVGAFLLVAVTAGAPPVLAVGLLAYFSNLCACLTHYSTGPVIVLVVNPSGNPSPGVPDREEDRVGVSVIGPSSSRYPSPTNHKPQNADPTPAR